MVEALRPPYEPGEILRHLYQIGLHSAPLIVMSGFAIGAVLSMHTRASLERFGAEAMISARRLSLPELNGSLSLGCLSNECGAGGWTRT
jgi:ABC-type transporter Mla maintaining outer membrane lipid asymmetry permease subunit MlaE